MIRLSTAHAKARLNTEVTVDDCEDALAIMMYALQNDTQVVKRLKAGGKKADTAPADAEEAAMGDDVWEEKVSEEKMAEPAPPVRTGSKATKRKPPAATIVRVDSDSGMDIEPASASKRTRYDSDMDTENSLPARTSSRKSVNVPGAVQSVQLSSERRALFKRLLGKYMNDKRLDDEELDIILPAINQQVAPQPVFTRDEAEAMLQLLSSENLIMWSAGRVWKI